MENPPPNFFENPIGVPFQGTFSQNVKTTDENNFYSPIDKKFRNIKKQELDGSSYILDNIIPDPEKKPYTKKFSKRTSLYNQDEETLLLRPEEETPFRKLFFSRTNFLCLQRMIKHQVFNKIKYVIGDQKETELLHIMRHVEITYSINPINPCIFVDEVLRLNGIVLEISIPIIINNIDQELGYLQEFETRHLFTLPLPKNTTSLGENPIKDAFLRPGRK